MWNETHRPSLNSKNVFRTLFQVWNREQQSLLQARQGKTVRLAGDGRYDSPGYSAKFMTYTFMEMETNKILHYVQVQLGEASFARFLEG